MAANNQIVSGYLYQIGEKAAKTDVKVLFNAFIKDNPEYRNSITQSYFQGVYNKYFNDADYRNKMDAKSSGGFATKSAIVLEPVKPIKLEIYNVKQEAGDSELFKAFRTGKVLDHYLSDDGGLMKGTVGMYTGGPGTGKTTLCYDKYLAVKANNPKAKCVFINSEMSKIDLKNELRKNPRLSKIDFILLADYGYDRALDVLQAVFTGGYDVVFIDSFEDIVGKVKSFMGMTSTDAEKQILSILINASENKEDCNKGVNTAIVIIQQVTKGGTFKGSNALKHAITYHGELFADKDGSRTMYYSKNRRCGSNIYKKLGYQLDQSHNLVYSVLEDVVIADDENEEEED
jgi:hypothetical protein